MQNIVIKPLTRDDIPRVSGKCWDGDLHQQKIADNQGILGFGAWEEDMSVGLLHFYRLSFPDPDISLLPEYARKKLLSSPVGFPITAAIHQKIRADGNVMALSCYHVGLKEGKFDEDREYFRKGIGNALLDAAIKWAKENGYAAIIAHGGTPELPLYNIWMGCMPYTSYQKRSFECYSKEEDGMKLPWWKDIDYPEFTETLRETIKQGITANELCARAMILRLK